MTTPLGFARDFQIGKLVIVTNRSLGQLQSQHPQADRRKIIPTQLRRRGAVR